MVKVRFNDPFQKLFSKIKDKSTKEKILKQIDKIRDNPEIGKPMKYSRKGTRELYIAPYRLSYEYLKEEDKIILLDLYHKDEQWIKIPTSKIIKFGKNGMAIVIPPEYMKEKGLKVGDIVSFEIYKISSHKP